VPGNGINTGVDIYIKEFIWDPLLIMLDPITALWQLVGDLVRPHVHTEELHAPESRGSINVPVKISLPSTSALNCCRSAYKFFHNGFPRLCLKTSEKWRISNCFQLERAVLGRRRFATTLDTNFGADGGKL
jgi:hypothetical protein